MTQEYNRAEYGRFAAKPGEPRKVRAVNLTDNTWKWLKSAAKALGVSRNDFLETLAGVERYPFIETDTPSKAELDAVKQERDELSDRVSDLMVQIQNLEFALKDVQGKSAGGEQAMPVKKKMTFWAGTKKTRSDLERCGLVSARQDRKIKNVGEVVTASDGSIWEFIGYPDEIPKKPKTYLCVEANGEKCHKWM